MAPCAPPCLRAHQAQPSSFGASHRVGSGWRTSPVARRPDPSTPRRPGRHRRVCACSALSGHLRGLACARGLLCTRAPGTLAVARSGASRGGGDRRLTDARHPLPRPSLLPAHHVGSGPGQFQRSCPAEWWRSDLRFAGIVDVPAPIENCAVISEQSFAVQPQNTQVGSSSSSLMITSMGWRGSSSKYIVHLPYRSPK